MRKLKALKKRLTEELDGRTAALWLSGGKDSRLLFEVLNDMGARIPLLRFDDGWSAEQKRHFHRSVRHRSQPLYSYGPVAGALIGDERGNISFVSLYPVGPDGASIPLVRHFVGDAGCAFDVPIEFARRRNAPVRFDVNVVGSKRSDRNYLYGSKPLVAAERWEMGGSTFLAPLYGWTDQEVLMGLKHYGIDWVDPEESLNTGNIAACTRCLSARPGTQVQCPKTGKKIAAVDWDREGSLQQFREAVGVEEA